MSVVRNSKYRHVFGTAFKDEFSYKDMRFNNNAWDSNYIEANTKYFAVSWKAGGGGSLAVIPHSRTGKIPADTPLLTGHTGPILDFRFHPFNDNLVATASEDSTVKIWGIPEGGLTETIDKPLQSLEAHSKKACGVEFNPVANNILATTAFDYKIRYWDIEAGVDKFCVEGFKDAVQSMSWNIDGSLMVAASKDKHLRIIDPRQSTFVTETPGHQGTRGSRTLWMKKKDRIFTVGFTKISERQYCFWDPRDMSKPLVTQDIDVSAGLLMPFFDEDSSVLFLAGKGDGNIRYYEIVDKEPYAHFLTAYSSNVSQNGMCMLPKLAVDTSSCEIARLYKLELETASVIPVMFQVPRKESSFQEDLYPDTFAPEAALTAEQWSAGENAAPNTISMRNAAEYNKAPKMSEFKPVAAPSRPKEEKKPISHDPKVLQKEVEELRAKVAELQKENSELKAKLADQ